MDPPDPPAARREAGYAMNREEEIEQALQGWLDGADYRPATRSELARLLVVAPGERRLLRTILRRWQDDGRLQVGKQGRYRRPAAGRRGRGLVTGTMRLWRNGRVMLECDGDAAGNEAAAVAGDGVVMLAVATGRWGTALPGDRVEARARMQPVRRGGRGWRGDGEDEMVVEVVRIVQRATHRLVGRLSKERGLAQVLLDEPMYPRRAVLHAGDEVAAPLKNGTTVVVELDVEGWRTPFDAPPGRLVRALGEGREDDDWMQRIICRHQLPLEFPDEVLTEADQVPDKVSESDCTGREDWRSRLVVTIDPEDAKDFDDAIAVEALEGGGWQLAVHIADVAHYVAAGGAMDREALKRGNSVYLADRVLPMLPERLSNGICSLRPGEDRLAQAVILQVDGRGSLRKARFADTVIRSRRRLTYEQAMSRLLPPEGNNDPAAAPDSDDDEITSMLREAWRLASVLRRRRMREGALDLDMAEVRAVIDDNGVVTGIQRVEYDESHQLIEECMLAANEAVAVELGRRGVHGLHRVHEDPEPEKLAAFAELAALHGYRVGDPTDSRQLNRLLGQLRGTVEERSLKVALLRSLKRAEYANRSLGHFGLAKDNYLHFTSPIRRYADLVVHRVLRAGGKGAGMSFAVMGETARHLSVTERVAAEAEMESQRVKQLQYLGSQAAAFPDQTWPAVVMEVRRYSMALELEEWMIRGWVRTASLPGGRYWFDAPLARQVPRERGRSARVYQVGSQVRVRVAGVDLHQLQVDFEIVA